MNTIKVLLIIPSLFCFLASCKSQVATRTAMDKKSPSKMEELTVSDNFQYRNTSTTLFDFAVVSATGEKVEKALVHFYGINDTSKEDLFFSGMTNQYGKVNIKLKIPHHFSEVKIKISKGNKASSFIYPKSSNSTRQFILN